ncbi:MAG TPA: tyrosine protein phosphatase, partial [Kaistiaceae bacterium]|nr:tyrosine protein phosphatase [Kaistiaceae bacterium]
HLFLGMNDVNAPLQGMIPPSAEHVGRLLDFIDRHGAGDPLVIHCWAGISRSTAAAFIAACHLAPERPEIDFARTIRARSATASPNPMLVAIADKLLDRGGRMVQAVRAIGRGRDAFEGVPFHLPLAAEAP